MRSRRRAMLVKLARTGHALVLAVGVSGCLATDLTPPADWREECVGRMALFLPGDSETAVDSIDSLGSRGLWIARRSGANSRFAFVDDVSGLTELRQGPVGAVSPPLTPKQIELLRVADAKRRQANFAEYTKLAAARGEIYESVMVDAGTPQATANRTRTGVGLFIELGDRVVMGAYRLETGADVNDKSLIPRLVANIRARRLAAQTRRSDI